jgi:nicotinamidase-related amidase
MIFLGPSPVLILIDLQKAIDHPSWGTRNNPAAEERVAELLAVWRQRQWPLIHVKHDSIEANSTYRPGQPGNEFKPESAPLTGEIVVAKNKGNAFVGTGLADILNAFAARTLVIAGVITNNSVESTVRMSGDLGYETYLVSDGCFTFGRPDWNGAERTAEEVHALSLANLHGEYCTVTTAREVLHAIEQSPREER